MATVKTRYVSEYIIDTVKAKMPLRQLLDLLDKVEKSAGGVTVSTGKTSKALKDGSVVLDQYKTKMSLVNELMKKFNISKAQASKIVNAYRGDIERTRQEAAAYARELDRLEKEQKQLNAAQSKGSGLTASFAKSLRNLLIQFIGITAGIAAFRAILLSSFNSIQELEDGLIGVIKTTGLSGIELKRFRDEFRELATKEVPLASKSLLDIASAAGQMGLKTSREIALLTEVTAELERSVDGISGGDAIKVLLTISRLQGETVESTDNLSSALVHLGNNTLQAEGAILEMGNFINRTTNRFNIGGAAVLGYSAFLAEAGERAEAAGTVFGTAFNAINKASVTGEKLKEFAKVAGLTAEEFAKLARDDINQAFLKFLEGLSAKGRNAGLAIEEIFGKGKRVDRVIGVLADKFEHLQEVMGLSTKGYIENKARTEEASRAFGTTSSRIQALTNSLGLLAENGFEPVSAEFKEIIDDLTEYVVSIIESDSISKEFASSILEVLVGALSILIDILKVVVENFLAVGLAIGVLKFDAIIAGVTSLAYAINTSLVAAIQKLTTAILANPFLAGAAAVLVSILAINNLVEKSANNLKKQIQSIGENSEKLMDISDRVAEAIKSKSASVISSIEKETKVLLENSKLQLEIEKKKLKSLTLAGAELNEIGKINIAREKTKNSIDRLEQETSSYEVALGRLSAASRTAKDENAELADSYEDINERIAESQKLVEDLMEKRDKRKALKKELEETEKQAKELVDQFQDLREEGSKSLDVLAQEWQSQLELEVSLADDLSNLLFLDLDKLIKDLGDKVKVILNVELESGTVSFTREGAKKLSELGSGLAGIAEKFDKTSQKVKELSGNLLEFGLSIEDIERAVSEVQTGEILKIAEEQAKRTGDEKALKTIVQKRAEIEKNLARLEFETAVKLLEIYGGPIPEALQAIIDKTRELFDAPTGGGGGNIFAVDNFVDGFASARDILIDGARAAGDALIAAGEESAGLVLQGISQFASGDYGSGVGSIASGLGLAGGGVGNFGGSRSGTFAAEGAELGNSLYPGWGAVIGAVVGAFVKKGADDMRIVFSDLGESIIAFAEGGLSDIASDIASVMGDFFATVQSLLDDQLNTGFAGLSIEIREDTVRVAVNGFVRTFLDLNEALGFAAQQILFANRNIDDLGDNMRQLFENMANPFNVYGSVGELKAAVQLADLADSGLGPSFKHLIDIFKEETAVALQFGLIMSDVMDLTRQRMEIEKENLNQQALGFVGVSTSTQALSDLIATLEAYNETLRDSEESRRRRMERILEEISELEDAGTELGLESGEITSETISRWKDEAKEAGVSWEEFQQTLSGVEREGIRLAERIERLKEEYEALAESLGQIPEEFLEAFLKMIKTVGKFKEQINLFQEIIDFQEKYGINIISSEKLKERMAELEFRMAQLRIKLLVIELAKNAELLGLSQDQLDMYARWADELSKIDFPGVSGSGGGRGRGRSRRDALESFRDEVSRLERTASGAAPALMSYIDSVERITESWRESGASAEELRRALSALSQIQVRDTLAPFRRSTLESSTGSLELFFDDLQERVSAAIDVLREALKEDAQGLDDALREIESGMSAELHNAALDVLSGLGASSIALARETESAIRNIQFLLDNLEEFGLTAEEVARSIREAALPQILSIAEEAARRSGNEEEANRLSEQRRQAEIDFQRLEFEALVSMLEAAGSINDEISEIIDRTREMFDEGVADDPLLFSSGTEALADLGSESARLSLETQSVIDKIKYLLESFKDLGLTMADVRAAVREISLPRILTIAEAQAKRIGDEEALLRFQKKRAQLELTMQRLQLEALAAQLEAAGALNPEFRRLINEVRKMFDEPDFEGGGGGKTLLSIANALGAVSVQTEDSIENIVDAIEDLNEMVAEGSVTASRAASIMREAAQNNFASFAGNLLSFVDTYYEDIGIGEELKRQQLQINFAIERAQLEINFALIEQAYRAGLIAEEQWNAVSNAMDLIRNTEPEFNKLAKSVSKVSGGSSGGGISKVSDELKKLREELEGIIKSSEKSRLGQFAGQLDSVFDKFARAGGILKTLNLSAEIFNRTAKALADDLNVVFNDVFRPVDEFSKEIRNERLTPAQRFLSARDEFRSLTNNLPSDLSTLDVDQIAKIVEAGRGFRESGIGMFGEGFGLGGIDRELLDVLDSLMDLQPEEEDLLLMAIEFLTNQNKISLEQVRSATSSVGVAVSDVNRSVSEIASENREKLSGILQSLGVDSELAKRLSDIFSRLGLGSPVASMLLNIVDEIGAQPFSDIIDAVENNDTQGIIDTLLTIDFSTVEIDGLFDALSALGVDNASLLSIANAVQGTLDVDSPAYADLDNIKKELQGKIDVENPNFDSLQIVNELKALALSTESIVSGISTLQGTTNAGIQEIRDRVFSLGDRLDTVAANIRFDIGRVDSVVRESRSILRSLEVVYLETGGYISKPTFAALHPGELVLNKNQTSSLMEIASSAGSMTFSSAIRQRSVDFSEISQGSINIAPIVSRMDAMLAKMNGSEILNCLGRIESTLSNTGSFTTGGKLQ